MRRAGRRRAARRLRRPAGAGHRPHRVQGLLAHPLARRPGRRGDRLRPGARHHAGALRAGRGRRRPAAASSPTSATRPGSPRWCARRRPEVVLHLAAQPLVRRSYQQPLETLQTNVLGTAHLLEAVRAAGRPCAVVVVTSDKCYENREWLYGYREDEPHGRPRRLLDVEGGGRAGDRLLAPLLLPPAPAGRSTAWRWPPPAPATWWAAATGPPTGSSRTPSPRWRRAGPSRCATRAASAPGSTSSSRSAATCCSGPGSCGPQAAAHAEAWNFGPRPEDARPVRDVVEALIAAWGSGALGGPARPGGAARGRPAAPLHRQGHRPPRLGAALALRRDLPPDRRVVPRLPRRRRAAELAALCRRPDPRVPGVLTDMDHKAEERRLTAEIVERARQHRPAPPAGRGGRRVRPGQHAGPLRRPGLRRGGARQPGRERRRVLAHRRALAHPAGARAWPTGTACSHARLVNSGSSANLLAVATLTSPPARRAAAPARRRGDHRGGRLPHHRGPGPPARDGAGLRRRDAARLQHRRLPAGGGALARAPGR